jgi:NDP-4-keto-2,6-dideoxyhexose 3-C-methyltransferase
MHSQIEVCRVCGNPELTPILDLGEQALTGVFPKSSDRQVEVGPLRLVKCHGSGSCGLVQLEHTYSFDELYGEDYGYRSGLNPTMVRHLQGKVDRILSSHDLPDDALVVDIGSNDGTTLRAYPDRYLRVGIDPTASKFLDFYPPDVEVVSDFFTEDALRQVVGHRQASVVTSFSMFYDLPSPLEFMRDIDRVLAPGGVWVFEQSYLPLMLERNSYDTVCHEHLEYYSLGQVAWMAEKIGFALVDVEFNDVNGGSFSVTAGRTVDGFHESPTATAIIQRELADGMDGLSPYEAFAGRVARSRDVLREFVDDANESGKTVGGLGASTKGNVILQYCGLTSADLVAIGEVNEEKYGAFTPGSLIPIWPEARLLDEDLDYLLVLPWHFRETFLSKQIKGHARLVFPLPQLEVADTSGPAAGHRPVEPGRG